MKHTGYYLLLFLLGACLFSSAKQRMTGCDKLMVQVPLTEKQNLAAKHGETGEGYGMSPLNFLLTDF